MQMNLLIAELFRSLLAHSFTRGWKSRFLFQRERDFRFPVSRFNGKTENGNPQGLAFEAKTDMIPDAVQGPLRCEFKSK